MDESTNIPDQAEKSLGKSETAGGSGANIGSALLSTGAGVIAGLSASAKLHKTALAHNKKSQHSLLEQITDIKSKRDKVSANGAEARFKVTKDFRPKPLEEGPELDAWNKELNEKIKKSSSAYEQEFHALNKKLEKLGKENAKLFDNSHVLEEAEKSNFIKKGLKVAIKGGAKVQAIIATVALSAALLTGYGIKKLHNRAKTEAQPESHVQRVEQQKTESLSTAWPIER